jgi:predicted DNA-binding transcriptional regulator AlpA
MRLRSCPNRESTHFVVAITASYLFWLANGNKRQQNEPCRNNHLDERGTAMEADYLSAPQLEQLTGTKAATWRYWAAMKVGPPSMKIGRRRVWKRTVIEAWLAEQELATSTGGGNVG